MFEKMLGNGLNLFGIVNTHILAPNGCSTPYIILFKQSFMCFINKICVGICVRNVLQGKVLN